VQIERHVELFAHLPERPVLLLIEVRDGIGIADLREAVGERADHAEVLDAALQFPRGEVGVLQRQRRQRLEPVGALFHLLG
jgi:hypothetical protein